jgi:hypothetical protein
MKSEEFEISFISVSILAQLYCEQMENVSFDLPLLSNEIVSIEH